MYQLSVQLGGKISQIHLPWARGAVIQFSVTLGLDGLGKDDMSSCFLYAWFLPALNLDFLHLMQS